jgi:hypothetical protein
MLEAHDAGLSSSKHMKISSVFGVKDPAKAVCGAVANSKSIFTVMREKSSLSQPYFHGFDYLRAVMLAISPYTRISVVAGATLLFCLSFFIKGPPDSGIRFLSNYSLGLYCLHGFASIFYIKLMGRPDDFPGKFLEFLVVMAASLLTAVALFNRRPFFLRS